MSMVMIMGMSSKTDLESGTDLILMLYESGLVGL